MKKMMFYLLLIVATLPSQNAFAIAEIPENTLIFVKDTTPSVSRIPEQQKIEERYYRSLGHISAFFFTLLVIAGTIFLVGLIAQKRDWLLYSGLCILGILLIWFVIFMLISKYYHKKAK